MQIHSFRLRPGQDLKEGIATVVEHEKIEAGALLTCVGSLTDVVIRLANQSTSTEWEGYFEIVSLTGTLSVYGSHLHLSVADSAGQMFGGHLMSGCKVYTTAEIVVGIIPNRLFVRELDPTYGYRELVIRDKPRK